MASPNVIASNGPMRSTNQYQDWCSMLRNGLLSRYSGFEHLSSIQNTRITPPLSSSTTLFAPKKSKLSLYTEVWVISTCIPYSYFQLAVRLFLISEGMYLVAKPKNEDHISCPADSYLAWGGGWNYKSRAHIERESWSSSFSIIFPWENSGLSCSLENPLV